MTAVLFSFAARIISAGTPLPVDIDELPTTGQPIPFARGIALTEALEPGSEDFRAAAVALMAGRSYRVGGGASPLFEIRKSNIPA